MLNDWRLNLHRNFEIAKNNKGPQIVTIVLGSEAAQGFWKNRFELTRSEIFRGDGSTEIVSVHEQTPKGNFLGTLNSWKTLIKTLSDRGKPRPNQISLVSMLFGKGTRLSPFTQALGNSKPKFPVPYKFEQGNLFLSIGELATFYSNLLIDHLQNCGFQGQVIKWGDEILIPGIKWDTQPNDLADTDAIRFVWITEPTPELAREKDWILINPETQLMTFQLARQELSNLKNRADSKKRTQQNQLGVNLGSLAISYDFLEIAMEVFGEDLQNPHRAVDWDPYAWLAFACEDKDEWLAEAKYEEMIGNPGIRNLEANYPDFFEKCSRVKSLLQQKKGRPLSIRALDFGDVFWVDLGQHLALRENLEVLAEDTERGQLMRELFHLPHTRDSKGNIVVNSTIHPQASIRNSLIIDSVINSPASFIQNGVVVGGSHDRVMMAEGGVALFCTVKDLEFHAANAVAFNSIATKVSLDEGGRHSTVVTLDRIYQLYTNESITDYKGENFERAICDNPISFETAAYLVGKIDSETITNLIHDARRSIQIE